MPFNSQKQVIELELRPTLFNHRKERMVAVIVNKKVKFQSNLSFLPYCCSVCCDVCVVL